MPKHEKPKADSELTTSKQLFDRLKATKSYDCKLTGLTTLHNHVCLVREKKEALNLLVFDLSDGKGKSAPSNNRANQETNDLGDDAHSVNSIAMSDSDLGLYRCRRLDLESILHSDKSKNEFVQMVYFKYVFFVGLTEKAIDTNSGVAKFLQFVLTNDKLNPFCMYFVKDTSSMKEIE